MRAPSLVRGHYQYDMTLTVTDEPPDRPEWVAETIRLVTDGTEGWRERLLARVAAASDDELGLGSDDAWGLGQVATHLLVVDRGVCQIALRLARGEPAGKTGQPRPGPGAVSRARIAELAARTRLAAASLRAEFPAAPNEAATARHPYYGDLNAFGWLLTLGNHYMAHLEALDRGTKTAL